MPLAGKQRRRRECARLATAAPSVRHHSRSVCACLALPSIHSDLPCQHTVVCNDEQRSTPTTLPPHRQLFEETHFSLEVVGDRRSTRRSDRSDARHDTLVVTHQLCQLHNTPTVCQITSHHITSHHITSHHITSHHITSHHITSHHIIPPQAPQFLVLVKVCRGLAPASCAAPVPPAAAH